MLIIVSRSKNPFIHFILIQLEIFVGSMNKLSTNKTKNQILLRIPVATINLIIRCVNALKGPTSFTGLMIASSVSVFKHYDGPQHL